MNPTDQRIAEYEQHQADLASQLEQQAGRYNLVSISRLLAFLGGIVLVVVAWPITPWLSYACLALSFAAFVGLVRVHDRIHRRRTHLQHLHAIQANEARILRRELDGLADGSEFADPEHPYSSDLDLFGPRSLFPYVNRCTSAAGRQLLASWFTDEPPPLETLLPRQRAIDDLAQRSAWRQEFQAHGSDERAQQQNTHALINWMTQPAWLLPRQGLALLHHLLPFATVPLVLLMVVGLFPPTLPLGLLLIHIVVLRLTGAQVQQTFSACSDCSHVLESYARLLRAIEQAKFEAPLLLDLQARLAIDGHPASARVEQLAGTLEFLAVRHNPVMHLPLNVLGFWDLFWTRRLERWKRANHSHITGWLDVANQFEALNSLANLRYNHPHWCLPEVRDDTDFTLRAEALGHALLNPATCVTNDLEIRSRPHLLLITGSNMGGKSTWLRSVGVGVVLALAGAPVCAQSFACVRVRVYTSMRTGDSLIENESTFYAELKCLRTITEAAATDQPTLFLLDEILRGTNSEDRHAGSRALILQLVRNHGVGLLATHDLELTHTREQHPDAIELFYFEAQIENGDMRFDYLLRPGICGSRNAAYLMRKMGIEM